MKDEHNVILILASSKWWIRSSGVRSQWLILVVNCSSSLFPGVPTSFNYITMEIHLNRFKDWPCVFNFSLFSFDLSFVFLILHGCSTWWFIKELIPSRSIHWDSFQRSSSFLHLAIRSAIPSTLCFQVVLCQFDNFFVFHDSQIVRNEIFKPINFFFGFILGYISPKAFL